MRSCLASRTVPLNQELLLLFTGENSLVMGANFLCIIEHITEK